MRGTVAKVATLGLLAGCGLARSGLLAQSSDPPAGLDASTTAPPPSDATVSGTPPRDDGSASADAADGGTGTGTDDAPSAADVTGIDASDARDASDASETVDACPPLSLDAAVSVATKILPAPTIDGDLSDWGCGPWTELDLANAAYSRQNGQVISARFAIRWDPANLYFAAHIVVPTLQGHDPTNPYNNDAVELYVSGESPPTGDYGVATHQYVVDWKNLAVDYGPIHYPPHQPASNPPHLTSQTKQVADGWQVEIAVGWQAVVKGKAPAAGTSIGFDVQLDDGDGTTQDTVVIETIAQSTMCSCQMCCCGQPNDRPSCDTLTFGTVVLE